MKILKWIAGGVFLLAAVWVGLLSLREPWVTPISGVRLEPSRRILKEADVAADSAFALLRRACDLSAFDLREAERELAEREKGEPREAGVWADPGELPALRALLPLLADRLDLCGRAVREEDPRVPTVLDYTTEMRYLQSARQLARFLRARAQLRWAEGDARGAYDDVESALRLGVLVSNGGALINHLVGAAVTNIACRGLWSMVVSEAWVPTEGSARLGDVLLEVDGSVDSFAECIRHEWLATHGAVAQVLDDPDGPMAGMLGSDLRPLLGFLPVLGALVGSSPRRVMRDLDYCYGHIIREGERSAWTAGAGFPWKRKNPLFVQNPAGYVLVGMLLPALGQARVKLEARSVCLRGMRVVLAVRESEVRQGRLPADLDELGPGILESIPLDPFDGKPMRYGVRADGSWRVWSVGSDGRDDGGMGTEWFDGKGADLVIPGRMEPAGGEGESGVP